jgi:hypothetical protein
MKTIKEWFESVKDETIRTELLENMLLVGKDTYTKSLEMAIRSGIEYLDNAEGLADMASNNQIELIDKPKIKKSDLLKRIENLEKIVETLHTVVIDPEPEPEQKIVFDWELSDKGKTIETVATPDKGKQLEEVCRINLYKHIFKQYDRGTPIFYIGHYE